MAGYWDSFSFTLCSGEYLETNKKTSHVFHGQWCLMKFFQWLCFDFFDFFNGCYKTKGRKNGNLRLYGARHMVKEHSDSERGNPLSPHRLFF